MGCLEKLCLAMSSDNKRIKDLENQDDVDEDVLDYVKFRRREEEKLLKLLVKDP